MRNLVTPTNDEQFNQLLCAMNWMRGCIPHYAEIVDPLQQIVERVFTERGTRKSQGLAAFPLSAYGWTATSEALLRSLVDKICKQATLYWPDPLSQLQL